MSLVFALGWNNLYRFDHDLQRIIPVKDADGKYVKIEVSGQVFGIPQARALLRMAVNLDQSDARLLRTCIDNYRVRLINGPHRSEGTQLHTTLHCGDYTENITFHIKHSQSNNMNPSIVSQLPTSKTNPKTGNPVDDGRAPVILNCTAL